MTIYCSVCNDHEALNETATHEQIAEMNRKGWTVIKATGDGYGFVLDCLCPDCTVAAIERAK